jgi:predicted metal-dependent phosphoesterase TrpH
MLGLGIAPENVTLCGTLERVQSARNERNELIAGRLTQLGIPCDINDVRKYASDDGVVGRPHFAQWLIANGRDPNDINLSLGHLPLGQVDLLVYH